MTVTDAEVAQSISRVADIVQGATERYRSRDDGRSPISARFILYALFDLDSATYFAPENGAHMVLWENRWRRTRRDGTRPHYKELHDAVYRSLTDGLPGDKGILGRYTPDQVRDVARRLLSDQGTRKP